MNSLYFVSVQWVTAGAKPYMPLVEGVLGAHGDWLRFREGLWFAYSADNAKQIMEHLMAALPGEQVFVGAFDGHHWYGHAAHWVWNWINARADGTAAPGTVPPPIALPPPPQFKS